MFREDEIRALLPCGDLGEPLYYFQQLPSTNDEAARLALTGIKHGAMVVADEQTRGRGRLERRWITAPGSGLAFSLVLRPSPDPPGTSLYFAGLGALAVAKALERHDLSPEIKWPNDVLLDGRKTAGILAEASWKDGEMSHLILGIGVNVHPGSVPPSESLRYPATCVDREAGREIERAGLLRDIVCEIRGLLERRGAEWVEDWETRLAFRGQQVTVVLADENLRGRLDGLSPEGQARLTIGSESVCLATGEIRPVDVDRG